MMSILTAILVLVSFAFGFLAARASLGGVLVDRDILRALKSGAIKIRPFSREALGTNSYDVHLASTLRVYLDPHVPLDAKAYRGFREIALPETGYELQPGELYLGVTTEYTESLKHVPILNGKSSLGRLGLSIHVTAGTGDRGFKGHWTLEMTVVRPLRIYPNMPIGQLLWFVTNGVPLVPYASKPSAKYTNSVETANPVPGPSEMWKNFRDGKASIS